MAQEDWSRALRYWQRALQLSYDLVGARNATIKFPRRGVDFDWYELAWRKIALDWETIKQGLGVQVQPILYTALLKVLRVCGEHELVRRIAAAALRDFPRDEELVLQVLPSLVRHGTRRSVAAAIEALGEYVDISDLGNLGGRIRNASAVLDDLRERGTCSIDELRVLTVPSGGVFASVIRSSDFWDEGRIHQVTRELAERDHWPERTSNTDRLSEASWLLSKRFAKWRGWRAGVDDETLARSVFHIMKHELVLKLPVDRLAAEIVAESGSEPIFIEMRSVNLFYLASYPSSRMHLIYLYAALRELGANVQFVCFAASRRRKRWKMPVPAVYRAPTLVARPMTKGHRPTSTPFAKLEGQSRELLVPSGIRSVRRVLDHLEAQPIVLNSGFAISEFAYDRTTRHRTLYSPNATVHPSAKRFPKFVFPTEEVRRWTQLGETPQPSRLTSRRTNESGEVAILSVGSLDTSNWYEWLGAAVLPYFRGIVDRTDRLIVKTGIKAVHTGDYLYSEPVLVASRVSASGGKVNLWPHSSNPVHLQFHDPTSVSTVHCVTKAGAEAWQEHAPRAKVIHESDLMIAKDLQQVEWNPQEPVSLVVVGGRPVMRNLPILAIGDHEKLYQEFFLALQGLVDRKLLKVYFKPRGLTGEHESWLEGVVGRAAGWSRQLAHPTRLNLPNPVYASISVGSSALLEGVSRGIPGLIVRGRTPVRDYISVNGPGLAQYFVQESLQFLESLTEQANWERTRSQQQRDLAEELGLRARHV